MGKLPPTIVQKEEYSIGEREATEVVDPKFLLLAKSNYIQESTRFPIDAYTGLALLIVDYSSIYTLMAEISS